MATLDITFGTESGAAIRQLAHQLQQLAGQLPDRSATGASTVLTIDNAPGGGDVGVQISAGPITTTQLVTKA